jgi:hypothetical protein
MMRALLYWFAGYLPCRIIAEADRPYLERYYLATLFGWQFYLHRFVASDPDRGLHDHPWPRAFSIILAGWYWEETRGKPRRIAWFNSLTGDTFHRVVLPRAFLAAEVAAAFDKYGRTAAIPTPEALPADCWTLFFHRNTRSKEWGFLRGARGSAQVFTPYTYPTEGDQTHWWLRAPDGHNEPRRAPR